MRFKISAAFIILTVFMLSASTNAKPTLGESYLGAYLGAQKIGYLTYRIDEINTDGEVGYRVSSIMNSQLKVLGTDLSQYITTVVLADKNMNPRTQDFSMSSGGKTTTVRARYLPKKVECNVSAGSGATVQTVPIPPNVKLIVDNVFGFSQPQLTIGSQTRDYYFNPLTMTIDTIDTKVERAEKLVIDGKEYDTVVLTSSTNLGKMTLWQTPDGNIVQIEAVMGIRMVVESREKAMSGLGGGTPQDFAVLTSVKPDKPIPAPRKLRSLSLVLSGIDEQAFAISDFRQSVKIDPAEKHAQVKIVVPSQVSRSIAKLPVKVVSLQADIISTPYIDCDNPAIRKQAKEIVAMEKNITIVCSRLRNWIYKNMQTQTDIGITRSASDVLSTRTGVCRDYAILFAGLARSLGVPTRVVSGLVYADDAFYYHAWVECWTGRWTAYDATLSTDYVDATHIKLAEGDATSMFTLSRVIGGLKARVVSYDPK